MRRSGGRSDGFTLIELLVVVAIIGSLVAILLPALRDARAISKSAVCAANLRQMGIAIYTYANDNRGFIPRGPAAVHPFDFAGDAFATNQLWVGAGGDGPPPDHPLQRTGAGTLLDSSFEDPRALFCPADDNLNLQEELPKIGTAADAFGSYLYRQLDRLPAQAAAGRLDRLGTNIVADRQVPVAALALDTNSLGPGPLRHTNHRGQRVNVLFRDGSSGSWSNRYGWFTLPAETFADPTAIPTRIDQILTNADFAFRGRPVDAPLLSGAGS